jgi:hypothetical protein
MESINAARVYYLPKSKHSRMLEQTLNPEVSASHKKSFLKQSDRNVTHIIAAEGLCCPMKFTNKEV